MADFRIDGRMKVKGLKENFKKTFGLSLRVYTRYPPRRTPLWLQSGLRVPKVAKSL